MFKEVGMDNAMVQEILSIFRPVIDKHNGLVKAVMLYGSAVTKRKVRGSDIDVMVILDDSAGDIPQGVYSAVSSDLNKVVEKANKTGLDLHLQSPKPLSLWWDMVRSGNPLAITAMTDGLALYDPSDYLKPLQLLLQQGKLSGTRERAHALIHGAPEKLRKARTIFLEEITSDLLLAMSEAGQAVLMFAGLAPPSAKSLGGELRKKFVSKKLLSDGVVKDYEDFYELARKIEHGETTRLSGRELDKHLDRAVDFVEAVEGLFGALEHAKKRLMIEEAHKEAFDAAQRALEKMGRKPVKSVAVIDDFKKHFVDTGMVSRLHLDVLKRLDKNRKALEEGRLEELAEAEIYAGGMYAKTLRRALKDVEKEEKR